MATAERRITDDMEFWLDDAMSEATAHELACTLEQRAECRLAIVDDVPRVHLGPLCGLRHVFPGLRHSGPDSGLWLDTTNNSACYQGRRAILSSEEFVVVAALAAARGEPVTHRQIAASVWGDCAPERAADLIQAHLRHIRSKFRSAGLPDLVLQTMQGIVLKSTVRERV